MKRTSLTRCLDLTLQRFNVLTLCLQLLHRRVQRNVKLAHGRLGFVAHVRDAERAAFDFSVAALASAAGEQVNSAMPGGNASAFCVPASNTSMPSVSNSILAAESELTASTMNITSAYFLLSAAMSASGLITPVEVSL